MNRKKGLIGGVKAVLPMSLANVARARQHADGCKALKDLALWKKERRPMLPVCRTSSTKCNELNVVLPNMICANNLPFSQAESAFFQNIATVLRPGLKPPLAKWSQLNCRRIPMLFKNNEDGTHGSLFCFLFFLQFLLHT